MNYEEKRNCYEQGAVSPSATTAAVASAEEFILRFNEIYVQNQPLHGAAIYRELVKEYLSDFIYSAQ